MTASYLNPKCEVREIADKGGRGVFAVAPLATGELVGMWGGSIIPSAAIATVPDYLRIYLAQVDDDLFIICPPGGPDYINHSCNPNVGLFGQIGLVAMRPIAPGEELMFDYAMCDSVPYDEFPCQCGAPNCRGQITGDDWRRPELQARYRGYFSAYLARRLEALETEGMRD